MKNRKLQYIIICAACGISLFSLYIFMPYQTVYLAEIDCPAALMGVISGINNFLPMFLPILFGVFMDYTGRKKPIVILGMFMQMVGLLIKFLMPDAYGYLIGNLLLGIGTAAQSAYTLLIIPYYREEELPKAFAVMGGVGNGSILLAYLLAMIIYDHFGMQAISAISLTGGMVGLVLGFVIKEMPQKTNKGTAAFDLIPVLKNRQFLIYSFLYMMQAGICYTATSVLTPAFLQQNGVSNVWVGVISNAYVMAATITPIIYSQRMSGKIFGRKELLSLLFLGLAGYCILCSFINSVSLICLLQILPGISAVITVICAGRAIREIPEEKRATALAVHNVFYSVGCLVFPILCGQIMQVQTVEISFVFLGITSLIVFAAALKLSFFKK